MLSSCESHGVKSRASCGHTVRRSFISSSLLKFTIALLLLALYIGKLNIVAENFEHLHKGLIHDGIAFLDEPIHILTRCADFFSEFRLCHISFDALHFDIDFKIVLTILILCCF